MKVATSSITTAEKRLAEFRQDRVDLVDDPESVKLIDGLIEAAEAEIEALTSERDVSRDQLGKAKRRAGLEFWVVHNSSLLSYYICPPNDTCFTVHCDSKFMCADSFSVYLIIAELQCIF